MSDNNELEQYWLPADVAAAMRERANNVAPPHWEADRWAVAWPSTTPNPSHLVCGWIMSGIGGCSCWR